MSEFIFASGVKAKAKGIGQSLRWENYKTKEGLFRPDYVVINDIDTIENTQSKKTIDKNMARMLNEIFWGLAPNAKRVVLWNVIRTDGIIPRLKQIAKNSKKQRWTVFWQALIVNGLIAWADRYAWTDEEALATGKESIEKLQEDGKVAFWQNQQLEAYNWESIIGRDMIKYGRVAMYDYIWIGVDPAISENSGTDKMGVVAVGFIEEKRENWEVRIWKYVIESHGLLWKEKDPTRSVALIKEVYTRLKERSSTGRITCRVENNAFQSMYRKLLQSEHLACVPYNSTKDKVTRFLEHESEFTKGEIFFEPEKNEELIDDVVVFPESEYKDVVDAMVFWLQWGQWVVVHRISTK